MGKDDAADKTCASVPSTPSRDAEQAALAMQRRTTSWILLFTLLFSTTFAGCLGDDRPPEDPVVSPTAGPDPFIPTEGGRKRASTLTANDTVQAPEWQVGDWFGHHIYLQGGPSDGRHYNTVVIDETRGGWLLAADDPEAAREEAAWDLPVAGTIGPGLTTTAFGAQWDLFRFPLADGKTWDGTVEARDLQRYDLLLFAATFTAAFDESIDVNGATLAGYRITGTSDDGVVVDASYIPAIRWYGHITVYDVRTDDPDDFFLKTTSMGYGTDWTGTYHVAAGDLVTEHFGGFVVFAPDAIGPSAPETFTVPEDTDFLFGQVFAFAWNGAAETVLVDPEGALHETRAAHAGADRDGDVAVWMVDEPAIAGDWAVATAGGGPTWVAGAYLFALVMEEGAL